MTRFGIFAPLSVFLLWTAVSDAQAPLVAIASTRQYELHSKALGRDYRLFVSLPERYSTADTAHYPVLYVLDGNDNFPLAAETQRLLRLQAEVPDLIIAGIGYPVSFFRETLARRWADYTPSTDSKADSARAAQMGVAHLEAGLASGGAQAFLSVLRDEVIPFMEANHRTTHDRGLYGHSLGALFVSYALLTAPELFSRYAISSPSLWWNGSDTFAREAAFAGTHRALNARVYLSVGADEGPAMNGGKDRLAKILMDRHYTGLTIASHTFEGESHVSVIPAAMSRGMRFLYAADSTR